MKIDDVPKMVLTQEALKAAGKTIKVKGVLEGDTCKGKRIRIDAMEKSTGNPPVRLMAVHLVQDIGAYEMLLPKSDAPIWMMASCDVNGDNFITPRVDYTGGFAKNPITPSADVTGVVITLGKEPVPMGGPPTPVGVPKGTAPPTAAAAPGGAPAAAPGGVPAVAPGAAPAAASGSVPGAASRPAVPPAGATPAPASKPAAGASAAPSTTTARTPDPKTTAPRTAAPGAK